MKDRLQNSTTPDLDARLLVAHAGGDAALLEQYLMRREAGEPVAQILGHKGFWTLDLKVSRNVLTPRPDTETILDTLLRLRPGKDAAYRVLDLGTGSGCIVLSVLSEYRNAFADAVDVSASALGIASENAKGTGLKDRVSFHLGEWCEPLPEGVQYDIIVSNPPYIPTAEIETLDVDVRVFEPRMALDGGADGLDCYRMLAKQIPSRMVAGAIALFEVGAGQSNDVAAIMERSGLRLVQTAKDLAGVARVVVLTKE